MKRLRSLLTGTLLRNIGLGLFCAVGAFAMGIETAGDVHPFATSEAALQETMTTDAVTPQGDVNGNGVIDADDSFLVYQFVQGLETPGADQIRRGDTDGDGRLTTIDLGEILRRLSRD